MQVLLFFLHYEKFMVRNSCSEIKVLLLNQKKSVNNLHSGFKKFLGTATQAESGIQIQVCVFSPSNVAFLSSLLTREWTQGRFLRNRVSQEILRKYRAKPCFQRTVFCTKDSQKRNEVTFVEVIKKMPFSSQCC